MECAPHEPRRCLALKETSVWVVETGPMFFLMEERRATQWKSPKPNGTYLPDIVKIATVLEVTLNTCAKPLLHEEAERM